MRAIGGLPPPSRALAALRLARMGSHALETLGRIRLETRGRVRDERLRAQAARLQRACAVACEFHGFEAHASGILPEAPAIYVANHRSYVDALVLASLFPSMPLAKGEVASWPIIGTSARSLGVVFVRRGDAHSGACALRQAWRGLDAGVSVLGFPEGTTSSSNDLLPFRRGLFGLARLAGAPVVPVSISYAEAGVDWVGDEWFLPHYFRTAMRKRTTALVRFGQALSPYAAGSPEDLAHLTRVRIRSLLRSST
jgi:1-acyl-sn-glycerol-3-phosphate acyltransferase